MIRSRQELTSIDTVQSIFRFGGSARLAALARQQGTTSCKERLSLVPAPEHARSALAFQDRGHAELSQPLDQFAALQPEVVGQHSQKLIDFAGKVTCAQGRNDRVCDRQDRSRV